MAPLTPGQLHTTRRRGEGAIRLMAPAPVRESAPPQSPSPKTS
ncbi:MAG TPA: hypothetical protein VEY90_04410 [Thermoleophilaceae bacterium]|jgi:hypothetical protein|nr:hypothetical protein [Thermoleophilaceae bacterium]